MTVNFKRITKKKIQLKLEILLKNSLYKGKQKNIPINKTENFLIK